jgi:hypothetical protein
MPESQEEVIQAREAAVTTVAACATVIRATEASAQEVTVVRESAVTFVKEVEDRAALTEREARERVSWMEAESAATLTSAHREAKGFARRITLLEGELVEAC